MSLGEIGAGLDIQGILVNIARNQFSTFLQNQIYGDDETVDGPPSLYEMLLALLVKASAGSVSVPSLGAVAPVILSGRTQGHHVIPEYMCGAKKQEVVDLPLAQHSQLHRELFAFDTTVRVASTAYDLVFRKKKSWN